MSPRSFVSFVIDEYTEDWRKTKGIQGNGECEVVLGGEEIARAALLFGQKFPDVSAGSSTVGIYFLKIAPTQVEFIDNTTASGEPSENFGVEYRRETVLNVFSDLPNEVGDTIGAELQGVLNVNAPIGRSFTEYDLRALSVFAEQASIAIAN